MSVEEVQQQSEAQNGLKSEFRRFVPANQDSIAEGRPTFYVKRVNLLSEKPFSDVAATLDSKFSEHDGNSAWYPFLMNREEGMSEEEASQLMEQQEDSDELDVITIPFLVDKCLKNSEFSSRSNFREFCVEALSDGSKPLAVAQKYSGVPQFQRKVSEATEYTIMHVEMNYMNIDFNRFSRQINAFTENATNPVIGYGIPSKVDDAANGRRIQLSDWIPQQQFFMFYEGNIPIGGGSSSDTEWFIPPSSSEIKEIVNLDKADFDPDEHMKDLFEDYAQELEERTPREIANDEALQEINRAYVIENW